MALPLEMVKLLDKFSKIPFWGVKKIAPLQELLVILFPVSS
jgi:hypothetical protein